MKAFAALLENLVLTPARSQKLAHIIQYFRSTPDPDRGYALAVLTADLNLQNVKAGMLKDMVLEKIDPVLFAMSYDYVGDLAETIALIWPERRAQDLPSLSGLILQLETVQKDKLAAVMADHISAATPSERWAIVKLATGNLRVGVSARLAKTALAEYSGISLEDIEQVWHGQKPPYTDLFAWLDRQAPRPEIHRHRVFHPMMLSHPLDEEKDPALLDINDFQVEWKWDGIRVQLVLSEEEKLIFSRTGDNIVTAFPDILQNLSGTGVLDGELLVGHDFQPLPFNALQKRLNRKTVSAKLKKQYPAFVRLYDLLFDGEEDIRHLPLSERRQRLEAWTQRYPASCLDISPIIAATSWEELASIRALGAEEQGHEGVMLKRRDSFYQSGRPRGLWFKWKRDPRLIDAILMYAQRGHGKRSSYYSDYTFGVWKGNEIVPIGKAYFGFTDEELLQLDRWVRNNTMNRFGPVREVNKDLVFEIAFDSAQESGRHRSGVALRFPRINRIRWDKPAQEADTIEAVKLLIGAGNK